VLVIQQVNGGVIHLVMPAVWTDCLRSTGYILNGEWHKEHGLPENFLEGMGRSHKVGLGR
jgi:hypothetical protein